VTNQKIFFTITECSLGLVLVATNPIGICAIFLGDDANSLQTELQNRFPKVTLVNAFNLNEEILVKLIRYIDAPKSKIDLPLDIQGTAFQKMVWDALLSIPCGKTVSYSEVANQINKPKAIRAIANACGANKLAVVIPCHRVIKNDGTLSGYRWGIDRKRKLLASESNGEIPSCDFLKKSAL
jgi:AraC family transcriptional regulator of adaptative response/methylated-DNA-[protein]-cysteine methyltransferase